MAVDTAKGGVSNIHADFADCGYSQYLTDIGQQFQHHLRKNEPIMTDFLADAVCSNDSDYDFIDRKKVTGW